ncbi:MAG: gamma-glutamyltransferase [Pseudomonadota bacterium]
MTPRSLMAVRPARALWAVGAASLMLLAGTGGQAWGQAAAGGAPEAATGSTARQAVHARRQMVATANGHASMAAQQILRAGGSAVDAAIAASMVLNLTEPQSSGIGGGAFMLTWDPERRAMGAFDGRETTPAAARPERFIGADGRPIPFAEAVHSGLSVGVPGLLRMLELAHRQDGVLPWARLFEPAIALAESGFAVSERLHKLIASDLFLKNDAAARAYFFDAAGQPLAIGALLRNPELAQVLRRVASEGADAFYRGDIARDMVAAVAGHRRPGDLSEPDLQAYRALQRPVLCGPYRAYQVCGMPPPSSGGIAVLAMLGLLERFDLAAWAPDSAQAVHLLAEAGRLAYADRDVYVADPDFVTVPTQALVDPAYLRSRSALIDMQRSMGRASHGVPPGWSVSAGPDVSAEVPATTHLSVVDSRGRAVSMTGTIEAQFGSRIMVRGFLLNNQLTDFSLAPQEGGRPVANRVEPGKRPRSSMAPTLVFDPQGQLFMVTGSPGGSLIINYVAKTLIGVIDGKLDIQQAIALPNRGSRNRATEIEKGSALEALVGPLRAMGHEVQAIEMTSGLQGIVRTPDGLVGGADPRREGLVLGD